ncbi:hormogonium polysaccharide biosynthesis protein HpsA [Nodularia harveyana UHCC-0300]|uniref:Hormogonium polysaccharide biosynthesis protein HpsA n=1 Tax=Nodularia harveyana UHCC-0300 TaxID=2974287 RepID=A0ABU5UCK7_9CYAN|nr:hormogonium polysaccharide biosynthesis protein HpsA [Nodularia harveyana]MEA5581276.1 hormogonium polysaccharide biosynthesis protein HpsA [Nodularia harveyana UHCC-0300]
MSRKRHLVKNIKKNFPKISKNFISAIKKKLVWLVRTLFVTKKRRSSANAGFVLPTVAMVSIVAVLLTTAILYRSYDRAQNASNVRVNQAVLSAATPAIDRGRAKLSKLFEDKRLPRATPTDEALYELLTGSLPEYTFGDETPLKLTYTQGAINQELRTAWRFPIDTDNNGKFDSYTLYGIYFRTPPVADNQYSRARTPLEARTPPMSQGNLDPVCGDGTSAILVGNTGWIKQNNELRKSFFVYTATVPITDIDASIPATDAGNYEEYQGNKSIAALEYQQDRLQIPPNNNAVVYEDDIILTPGPAFNLNGAIFTNSNLLAAGQNNGQITMHQVSAKDSCYYEARNAKIFVGGNLAMGNTGAGSHSTNRIPKVHLFNGKTDPVIVKDFEYSATQSPGEIAYNNLAYEDRIERLVDAQFSNAPTSDPSEVRQGIEKRQQDLGLASYTSEEIDEFRREQLELYFKRRTRRVPYREVAFNGTDPSPSPLLQGDGESLRPNDRWIYPTDPTNGTNGASYTRLTLRINGASLEPKASSPDEIRDNGGREAELGDRVIVGNNLPELWWDNTKERFVGPGFDDTQALANVRWNQPTGTTEGRFRRSTVQTLADVGSTGRDGEWELDAARVPGDPTDPVGGLRVITGAGIYLHEEGLPWRFIDSIKNVWPDTNPVPQAPLPPGLEGREVVDDMVTQPGRIRPYWMYAGLITDPDRDPSRITYKWREMMDDPATTDRDEQNETPFLQMRATAVYHYKANEYNQQNPRPIACVSSFYVPTSETTASNGNSFTGFNATYNLPVAAGIPNNANGLSNNGIVYPPPRTLEAAPIYRPLLEYESQLRYPPEPGQNPDQARLLDGGLLARALAKAPANRTLAEQSALDAQICALEIRYNAGSFRPVTTNPPIPHGAIRETTFLAHREVRQNSRNANTVYDLPIKDRQMIETRATVLDLNLLRTTPIGPGPAASQEYLLPNSGLIYATRDDALRDRSDTNPAISALDYILDPTRRPNAIMLVNGERLWRQQNYRDAEKGLILATNLPAYVKGNFNRHTQQEFNQTLNDNWSNFYNRTTLNPNFACRRNDPRLPDCTVGDEWRPATVLADVVTLLSGNFQEGFRDQGDYDWSDQYSDPDFASIPSGITGDFSAFNNYVTEANWRDPNNANSRPGYFSSYLNNFVTPINLKVKQGGYLTEACVIPPGETEASYCSDPLNWRIQVSNSCNPNGIMGPANGFLHGAAEGDQSGIVPPNNPNNVSNRIKTGFVFQDPQTWQNNVNTSPGNGNCFAGDNVIRRLALVRQQNGRLVNPPEVWASASDGRIRRFPLGSDRSVVGNLQLQQLPPDLQDSGDGSIPWLNPVINGSGNITALNPILQIKNPRATATDPTNNARVQAGDNWLQRVTNDNTFNLIVAAGDNPARAGNNNVEDNGGLHNFVRFMEHWDAGARISGAFMQVKKSAYATGSFTTALRNTNELNYAIGLNAGGIGSGTATGYDPPNRLWGYDVALLSQSPDLFAQKLVITPPDLPDEYFREVGRDDPWIKTLLCGETAEGDYSATGDDSQYQCS